jgi:predicted ABC-type ATPase
VAHWPRPNSLSLQDHPNLTVIAGPNGSGKSTIFEELGLLGIQTGVFLNPDIIAKGLDGPDNTRDYRAGCEALERCRSYIDNGETFTRESTLSSAEIVNTMRRAKEAGFTVNLVFVGVESVAYSIDRVAKRVRSGGHDIPVEDQIRRFDKTFANLPIAAAIADHCIIFDNSGASHELVAIIRSGKVAQRTDKQIIWLDEALRQLT